MENGKATYTVKQLAKLAGVSVRTLHLYDQLGLLKPGNRTGSRYRMYGEEQLLRLQQILFYKELDFSLKSIGSILDDPDFNLLQALQGHREALEVRRDRLEILLHTIDRTVDHLKHKNMQNYGELYEGMPKEQAAAWRQEAVEKWGEADVAQSENALISLTKEQLDVLKADQKDITAKLRELQNADSKGIAVQQQIARHYQNILGFWGLPAGSIQLADRYKGLADMYLADDRYLAANGKPDPAFAAFMRQAMHHFADQLSSAKSV